MSIQSDYSKTIDKIKKAREALQFEIDHLKTTTGCLGEMLAGTGHFNDFAEVETDVSDTGGAIRDLFAMLNDLPDEMPETE